MADLDNITRQWAYSLQSPFYLAIIATLFGHNIHNVTVKSLSQKSPSPYGRGLG